MFVPTAITTHAGPLSFLPSLPRAETLAAEEPTMSDPYNPYYRGAFPGGDGAPPPLPPYSDFDVDLVATRYTGTPRSHPSSADVGAFESHLGARRFAEVLYQYHQSCMGSHSTVGQSETLYSSITMAKRPRLESSLPIYPQRPGQKDCAFYMSTGTCKYGETCKFDHPQWVPEGGVPNWKEVLNDEDYYPERPGEPDCPYLLSSRCKFKSKCKFNHPKEMVNALGTRTDNESLIADTTILPVRPSEPVCSFYAKTGKCKFGAVCKFNHPKLEDIKTPSLIAKETIYRATTDAAAHIGGTDDSVPAKTHAPIAPAEAHNAKGLPIRPVFVDIAFMAPVQATLPFPAPIVPAVALNPAANFLQSFDFHATHVPVEPMPMIYPQRPGEIVCDFYMKTGSCKYAQNCKFHHPFDRSAPHSKENEDTQQPVALTLAGLPRREIYKC
ncbi:Zinc finger CCCH domain-containing protein 37 [Zea mays]|uniref:Zinc finger CCCH domain-containing protein 37 n=1 Tax=Zea mays TaxID=4577 RepID=A0A1D6NMC0_MAIZE|nr:Zinc finger CCCH domain-containing protein 37 [Zea mays]